MTTALQPPRRLDALLAVLNGAVGDYLVRTRNGLATEMAIVNAAAPRGPRLALLVHGLMCTETVWRFPDGSDYGSRLAEDLGYSPLYVRYNSGRAIADNGAELARLLDGVADAEEIVPIGFSLGGLVIRSACHHGGRWLERVRRAAYIATPHLGAPLERVGRVVARLLRSIDDPYTQLCADLGDLRSDGIKDLGDADLRHEDRARRRCTVTLRDPRHPVPLLPGIQHYLVAGAIARDPRLALLFGDALVPVRSGTDGACADGASLALPPDHVRVLGGVAHLALAHHPDVYAQLQEWLR